MLPYHRPCVLLVEDEPHFYKILVRRLSGEGYSVTLATSYREAREQLDTGHFHLAILDYRLDADDEMNADGLKVLKEVAKLGLLKVMPCILMSAYGTVPVVLKTQELGAVKFISKETGYIAKLQETVRTQFNERIRVQFNLQYENDSPEKIKECVHQIHETEKRWPPPDHLLPEVQDLMGKMFYGAERVWISDLVAGFSGSVVLYVHPTWPTGLGQSRVVKIGRRDKIGTEEQNYQQCVDHFLPANRATQLQAHLTRHLGALLYTLADANVDKIVDFEAFYRKQPSPKLIVSALQKLFRETCQLWYMNRARPRFLNLRDLYLEAFNLQYQPDRLSRELAELRCGLDPGSALIPFESLGLTLPNPLRWLANDRAVVMPVFCSITHGDLHAGNILMNENGDCWLIDFYRTYQSHILRDFVVLESDIKFRLQNQLKIEEFFRLEQLLLRLDHPAKIPADLQDLPPAARKAAEVIAGLRSEAWRLLDAANQSVENIQREYLISLLMTTLNLLRLRYYKDSPALQPRRELALLSTALICQHLQ